MLRRNVSFILIIISVAFCSCQKSDNGQDNNSDHRNKDTSNDSLNILGSLVDVFKLNNYKLSYNYAKMALSLAQRKHDPLLLARANIILGKVFFNTKIDSSFYYFSVANKIADKYKINELKPDIFLNLSNIYVGAFDFTTGIFLLDSTINFASRTNNYEAMSDAYNCLGNIKYDLHDFENAKRMFHSAYAVAQKHTLNKQTGVALGSLARFEKDTGKSILLHKQAIEILKKSPGTEEAVARLLINIGIRYTIPDSSIKYYYSAINTIGENTSNEVTMIAYNNLVYSYIDKMDFGKAEASLKNHSIPIAEKILNYDWLATLYDSYYDVLMSAGKSKEAALAEKKAFNYREKAYDYKVTGQVRLLSALLDDKNKEIKLKSKDEELQRKSYNINLLIFILIGIGSFTLFFILWNIQKNRLNSENQRLMSARKVIELDEIYKERMAMELHDMTSPIYTSLLRQIEDVEIPDTGIKEELFSSLTLLADRIRKISHEMGGKYLEQLTFHEVLIGMCEEMQYRTEAQINLQIDHCDITLPPGKATHIIRIIQELLTNGVKYVKNGEIRLNVFLESPNINIIYQDNGTGFDYNKQQKTGLGLSNIFERTKLIGGKTFLESNQVRGTYWSICIPLT
jgi:signal transduction histidine kinase